MATPFGVLPGLQSIDAFLSFDLKITAVSLWSAALRHRDQVETESVFPTCRFRIGLLGCLLRLLNAFSEDLRSDVREKDGRMASAQGPMLFIECERRLLASKARRIWRGGRFHAYSSDSCGAPTGTDSQHPDD